MHLCDRLCEGLSCAIADGAHEDSVGVVVTSWLTFTQLLGVLGVPLTHSFLQYLTPARGLASYYDPRRLVR
jgi:hypothetical protein